RGRPGLQQMAEKIREHAPAPVEASSPPKVDPPLAAKPPSIRWLVLLATLPGSDPRAAEAVANDKLRAAKDLGGTALVYMYKTQLKGRYVVALGEPAARSDAIAAAAQARKRNLSADAFAEPDDGWELTGTAPFPVDIRSASAGTP